MVGQDKQSDSDAESRNPIWRKRLALFVLTALVWIAMELGFPAFLHMLQRALEH